MSAYILLKENDSIFAFLFGIIYITRSISLTYIIPYFSLRILQKLFFITMKNWTKNWQRPKSEVTHLRHPRRHHPIRHHRRLRRLRLLPQNGSRNTADTSSKSWPERRQRQHLPRLRNHPQRQHRSPQKPNCPNW